MYKLRLYLRALDYSPYYSHNDDRDSTDMFFYYLTFRNCFFLKLSQSKLTDTEPKVPKSASIFEPGGHSSGRIKLPDKTI